MIDTPTTIPTNKELLKATENARNNISILEAESQRLEKLIMVQKKELASIGNAIAGAKGELESEKKNLKVLKVELDNKNLEKDSIVKDIAALTKRQEDLKSKIDTGSTKLTEIEKTSTQLEKKNLDAISSISEQSKVLEDEKKKIEAKKKELGDILSKLSNI